MGKAAFSSGFTAGHLTEKHKAQGGYAIPGSPGWGSGLPSDRPENWSPLTGFSIWQDSPTSKPTRVLANVLPRPCEKPLKD
jgi:hypothetical protein